MTNHFSPSISQSSPSRVAVALMPATSEPAPGSVIAQASRYSPRMIGAIHCSACSGVSRSRAAPRGPRSTTAKPSPFVALPVSSSSATWPSIDRSLPPCSAGMLSIEKPAARAFGGSRRPRRGRSSRVPRSLLERIDLFLDEAADALFQLADLAGQLGDDHVAPPGRMTRLTVRSGFREQLRRFGRPARGRGERAVERRAAPLEHRLLERRAARGSRLPPRPADPAARSAGASSSSGTRPSASTSMSAATDVSSSGANTFRSRDLAARGRGQLEVLEDRDPGAIEPLEVEVAPVLVDALADRDRGDGERDVVARRRRGRSAASRPAGSPPQSATTTRSPAAAAPPRMSQAWRTSPSSGRPGA